VRYLKDACGDSGEWRQERGGQQDLRILEQGTAYCMGAGLMLIDCVD
jgi:hypothetical protein